MRLSPLLFSLCGACSGAADAPDAGSVFDAARIDAALAVDAAEGFDATSLLPRPLPIGIENVNDSPMKAAAYRTLLRFVPRQDLAIDRFYFGFKLLGASCDEPGRAGYGRGDGGTLHAELVEIDAAGHPGRILASESVNGCARWDQAVDEASATPVLVWANLEATLAAGTMYGLVIRNSHADPGDNFFSFNMPLADSALAGPHADNELSPGAAGAILGLDPREHVAWSDDAGQSWAYGSDNGQYRSYMNDHDRDHPATRMPQYGFRLDSGGHLAGQPYYAYGTDCVGCTVTYAGEKPRQISGLGGFIASDEGVGTLTIRSGGSEASCTPSPGYGFRTCTLTESFAAGSSYSIHATGAVEVMRMDFQQRTLFPEAGERIYQEDPGDGTNAADVPSLWAE